MKPASGDAKLVIRPFQTVDQKAVIDLWQACNLTRPWNNPQLDIARKLKVNPELLLVGTINGKIVATVMAGYEGHRGSVNYLGVHPDFRRKGYGKEMMQAVRDKLLAMGCPKINLNVRIGNNEALRFYEAIGFKPDEVVCLGKRLIDD